MKRFRKLLFTGVLCVLLSVPVLADVLPWPNNAFLQNHEGEVFYTYDSRDYVTYSPAGSVDFREAPGSDAVVFSKDNLERVSPCYFYESGGVRWGIVETYIDGSLSSGWCRMDELLPLYDNLLFMEEHAEELGGEVTFSDYTVEKVYFYDYPGSGVADDGRQIFSTSTSLPEFHTSYTDADGRVWGYCGNTKVNRYCWMCISDPYDNALPFIFAAKTDEFVEPYLIDQLPPPPKAGIALLSVEMLPYTVLAAVGVVVILAALGVYLLGRRKKRES